MCLKSECIFLGVSIRQFSREDVLLNRGRLLSFESFYIQSRFNGPPLSGNGGYVCGRLASWIDGCAEVTLRKPPPLEKELRVVQKDDKQQLWDGESLIAEAKVSTLELDVPTPPSWKEAVELSRSYVGFSFHAFPTCFVCGTERDPEDGLCLYPGEHAEHAFVAAPWIPASSLADASNAQVVAPEFMWSAMDCPGAFSVGLGEDRLVVLGRLTAEIYHPVQIGEQCVVVGWPIAESGKKFDAGTAVFDATGRLCGAAKATWIAIPPDAFNALSKS